MKQRAKKGGVCWPSIWNLGCQTKFRELSCSVSPVYRRLLRPVDYGVEGVSVERY